MESFSPLIEQNEYLSVGNISNLIWIFEWNFVYHIAAGNVDKNK